MIDELKNKFNQRGIRYCEEFTSGNYDNEENLINEKILTLTTEYCEIGFRKETVYFVFIAQSDSWSLNFHETIKKIKNLQIYGLKNFKKNYNLDGGIEKEIKSEDYFQMQFTYNMSEISPDFLINEYDSIIKHIKENGVLIVNQLEKTLSKS